MRFGEGGAACHKRSVRQRRSGGFVPNERALSLQLGTDPRRETAGRERQPQENWEENPVAGSVWKWPGSPSRPARRVCPRCPPRGPRRPSRVRTPARLTPPGVTEAARQSQPRPRARGSCGLRLCKGANGPRRGVRAASTRRRVTPAERGRRGRPGRTFDEGARGGEAVDRGLACGRHGADPSADTGDPDIRARVVPPLGFLRVPLGVTLGWRCGRQAQGRLCGVWFLANLARSPGRTRAQRAGSEGCAPRGPDPADPFASQTRPDPGPPHELAFTCRRVSAGTAGLPADSARREVALCPAAPAAAQGPSAWVAGPALLVTPRPRSLQLCLAPLDTSGAAPPPRRALASENPV